jgi:hypothetical protein
MIRQPETPSSQAIVTITEFGIIINVLHEKGLVVSVLLNILQKCGDESEEIIGAELIVNNRLRRLSLLKTNLLRSHFWYQ